MKRERWPAVVPTAPVHSPSSNTVKNARSASVSTGKAARLAPWAKPFRRLKATARRSLVWSESSSRRGNKPSHRHRSANTPMANSSHRAGIHTGMRCDAIKARTMSRPRTGKGTRRL